MSDAKIGYGLALFVASATTPAVVDVPLLEMTNVQIPGYAREMKEVTNFNSPGGYREYIGGLKDTDEVSLTANYLPGSNTDTVLLVMRNEDVGRKFEIRITQATPDYIVAFSAILIGYAPEPIEPGEPMMATVKLKLTSIPTFGV